MGLEIELVIHIDAKLFAYVVCCRLRKCCGAFTVQAKGNHPFPVHVARLSLGNMLSFHDDIAIGVFPLQLGWGAQIFADGGWIFLCRWDLNTDASIPPCRVTVASVIPLSLNRFCKNGDRSAHFAVKILYAFIAGLIYSGKTTGRSSPSLVCLIGLPSVKSPFYPKRNAKQRNIEHHGQNDQKK